MTSQTTNGAIPLQALTEVDPKIKIKCDEGKIQNGNFMSVDRSQNGGCFETSEATLQDKEKKEEMSNDFLAVPRCGQRMSIMEEESVKERIRLSLLKQCSAILRQGDQRYTKEILHRTFQDEDLLERIFRLFDVDKQDHLVQDDWIEFLKGRLTEGKQIDLLEQIESLAYVLCGNGVLTLDNFQIIFKNKVVSDKLYRVLDSNGDGYTTAEQIMEFLSNITSVRSRTGFDKASVDRLEQLFRQTVGDQKEITREQFRNIVVSKNPFFTERVFQIFDSDDSGTISLHEFIQAAHQFAGQAPEQKIRFLFKVYDLDGDGLIQHRELHHVMRACMEENDLDFSEEQLADMTAAMFEDADTENRGAITYEALKQQLEKHDGLLENLSISIDRWLIPPKPEEKPKSLKQKLKSMIPHQFSKQYFKNNYVLVGYLVVFCLVNVGLFVSRAIEYRRSNGYVIVARACGQCLNFTCSWVLVLMLRGCLTWARGRGAWRLLPIDHHLYLHKLTGVLVAGYSLVHTVMHLCNFSLIVVNDPVVNRHNLTLAEWLLTQRPGVFGLVGGCANPTGLALVVVLAMMLFCSRPAVRRGGNFEIFYWSHLLYIPFWVLLLFHGPNFWKWFLLPGTVYVIERITRLVWMRSEHGKTYISSGVLLPSRVTHLVVKRPPHFRFHAGDYVYVNVPAIASYEWHPFTISSAPEQEEHIWLHIRAVGEWTNRLYEYFDTQRARLQAGDVARGHSTLLRSASNRSTISSKSKKRSVDFSPTTYSNDAFCIQEENDSRDSTTVSESSLATTPNPALLNVPLKLTLEKSLSMPDMNTKKKQRIIALRDYSRSESEKSFDECEIRRANLRVLDLAYKSPQNKALAHSFRYLRNKPTIIAFKTPSMDDCEKDNLLTVARRRLSKTISPDKDKDVESAKNKTPEEIIKGNNDAFTNFPVGKPLEVQQTVLPTRQYMRFLSKEPNTQIPALGAGTEIYLDGPYGAPSSYIFHAQHAVLIAAGIGVTPFASILQCIMHRYWKTKNVCPNCQHTWNSDDVYANMSLKKVDFFWLNRSARSFEWLLSLLSALELQQGEAGGDRFLQLHLYVSGALQRADMRALHLQLALELLHHQGKRDLITGLKTRTNAGRPNWDKEFQRLAHENKGKVTVFYCGPPPLARILRLKCEQFGFNFRKEVF